MMLDLLWWIGWLFCATMVALPLAAVPLLGPVAGVVAWAVVAPWTTLLAMGAVHRCLPVSEAGTFRLPGDAGATRWAVRSWAPAVYLTLFQPLFFMSVGFQRIALRAFGARLGPGAWVTSRTVVREPHHVTIGARTLVGEFAHLACSLQPRPGLLVVAPITIGEDTLVGAHCHIGPGAVVGSRCVLEHAVAVGPMASVGDEARIGAGSAIYASARIGRGAIIGKHCLVPAHGVVGDGERLPDGTVLAAPARPTLAQVRP